jgi:hypothetical protein
MMLASMAEREQSFPTFGRLPVAFSTSFVQRYNFFLYPTHILQKKCSEKQKSAA